MELSEIAEFLNTKEIRDSIQETNKLDYAYHQLDALDAEYLTLYLLDLGINPADHVNDTIYNSMYANVALRGGEFVLNPNIVLIDKFGFFGVSGTSFKTLPGSSLNRIAFRAFAYSDLDELSFAEGLLRIDAEAFAEMIHLETISLPKSLKYLGDDIFANCDRLDNINYAGTVEEFNLLIENSASHLFNRFHCKSITCSDGEYRLSI